MYCIKITFDLQYHLPGPNLDKNSAGLSDPAPFYKNYTKLHFDAKHLKTSFSRGW